MNTPYMPDYLPLKDLNPSHFIMELGEANRELSRYDGLLSTLPNPNLLIAPFMTQEAVLSSRIEGTQATVDEVYEQEAGMEFGDRKLQDIQEVRNYSHALTHAAQNLKERPLTMMLIRETHQLLLRGVRGEQRTPGSFRTIQNWIGRPGSTLENAIYVPPSPSYVDMLMENWLNYIVEYKEIDPLVQAAIMHVQFEMIHPFLDGNGRMGRLLIPLFLYKKGVLQSPVFYMSAYLESNRRTYYNRLNGVHSEGRWNEWIAFFLRGVVEQAIANREKVEATIEYYDSLKLEMRNITHSGYAQLILDAMFEMPTYSMPSIIRRIQRKDPASKTSTLRSVLKKVASGNIVQCTRQAQGRSAHIYRLNGLYDIIYGKLSDTQS